ncbi:MAG: hypothetical protein ACLPKE_28235 [Streptosporangiaceae bacterium]
MRQATFHATITDTTPSIVKALLARATGSHTPATSTATSDKPPPAQTPASRPGQRSMRIPTRPRTLP